MRPQTKWNKANSELLTVSLYHVKDDDIRAWLKTIRPGEKQKTVKAALRLGIEQLLRAAPVDRMK